MIDRQSPLIAELCIVIDDSDRYGKVVIALIRSGRIPH
jgi:hypothetical protein